MIAKASVRKGTVIPLLAFCAVALFGFVALAIDLGMIIVARSECQNAADAAALAGARVLDNRYPPGSDPDAYDNRRLDAEANARAVVVANQFLNQKFAPERVTRAKAGLYDYQLDSERFRSVFPDSKPSGKSWTAMEVVVDGEQPGGSCSVAGPASASSCLAAPWGRQGTWALVVLIGVIMVVMVAIVAVVVVVVVVVEVVVVAVVVVVLSILINSFFLLFFHYS